MMAPQILKMVVGVVLLIPSTVLLFRGVKGPVSLGFRGNTHRMNSNSLTDENPSQKTQQDWESDFLGSVSAEKAKENLQHLTSTPHMAGLNYSCTLAEYMQNKMLDAGIDAQLEPVEALLSWPVSRSLSLMEDGEGLEDKVAFEAPLAEEVYAEDSTSDTIWRNRTYLCYSPSGDITAKLVYANYGRKEDFDTLKDAGVDVKGRLVLVRYSSVMFRGVSVFNAEERGAVGVLIYSDPADDGFGQGDEYPNGPWRPRSGVQRGSISHIAKCPGDPSRTASNATVEDVCGYSLEELMPSIIALPISWNDALPFLKVLGGPAAPESFIGALDNSSLSLLDKYTLGPSTQDVRLKVENELTKKTTWNVIGKIPGSLAEPYDRPVMIGNHRDAWIFGAVDPNSGTAAMLEIIRGFGKLSKSGWKPRRTLYICSWGGEEFGMIGSVAFAEANSNWMSKKVLAYINVDSGVSGPYIKVSATPSLITFWNRTLEDVPGINVMDHVSDSTGTSPPQVPTWNGKNGLLGSGSDFVSFLDHLGIPCIAFSIVQTDMGSDLYGVYHSIYDSFSWMEKYGDPSFERHVALARIWGLLALRLADDVTVPMDPTVHARYISSYVDTLSNDISSAISPALTSSAQPMNVEDEKKQAHEMVLLLLAPLRISVWLFMLSASLLLDQVKKEQSTSGTVSVHTNDALSLYHRQFLTNDGLPHRKWFKYVIVAPSADGYGGKTFPGVRWAINELSDGREPGKGLEDLRKNIAIASCRIAAAAMYMTHEIIHSHDEPAQFQRIEETVADIAEGGLSGVLL